MQTGFDRFQELSLQLLALPVTGHSTTIQAAEAESCHAPIPLLLAEGTWTDSCSPEFSTDSVLSVRCAHKQGLAPLPSICYAPFPDNIENHNGRLSCDHNAGCALHQIMAKWAGDEMRLMPQLYFDREQVGGT